MAGRQSTQQRSSALDSVDEWMRRRRAEIQRFGRDAEAAAHEALGQAARTGQQISAMKPSDVLVLGASILDQRKAARPASRSVTPQVTQADTSRRPPGVQATAAGQLVQQAVDQGLAGLRGAQDAATFGLGDRAYAGVRALDDAAHGADLGHAYEQRMAAEHARDEHDATHYGTARTIGQIAGTGAQLVALGPLDGAVLATARIAEATPLVARELAALGGAGAAVGVGGQVASDVARGRIGSVGDYAGAGLGGAAGALAAKGGRVGRAGAVAGATTSVAQDLLNGGAPSIDQAREAALVGNIIGGVSGALGRRAANQLSRSEKEQLGENVSRLRTLVRGERTALGGKSREYLSDGRYTYPDQRTIRASGEGDLVESKFGNHARLSQRQSQAHRELSNYRVDHTLPRDMGAALGLPAALFGHQDRSSASDGRIPGPSR